MQPHALFAISRFVERQRLFTIACWMVYRSLLDYINRESEKRIYNYLETGNHVHTLIDLYEAWNKPEEAEKWRAKLQQSEAKTE